jgi:hypothetical protein
LTASGYLDDAAAHGDLPAAAAQLDGAVLIVENHRLAAGGLNRDGFAGTRIIEADLVSATRFHDDLLDPLLAEPLAVPEIA